MIRELHDRFVSFAFALVNGLVLSIWQSGHSARIAAGAAPTLVGAAWWFCCRSGANCEVLGAVGVGGGAIKRLAAGAAPTGGGAGVRGGGRRRCGGART